MEEVMFQHTLGHQQVFLGAVLGTRGSYWSPGVPGYRQELALPFITWPSQAGEGISPYFPWPPQMQPGRAGIEETKEG